MNGEGSLANDLHDVRKRSTGAGSKRSHPLWVRAIALVTLVLGSQCTPVGEFKQAKRELTATVTADAEVLRELDEVEVFVESRTAGSKSWHLEDWGRFYDASDPSEWPLVVRVKDYDPKATYQATATARDAAGAITVQTRTIADPNLRSTQDLQLRFDRECLRRSNLCGKTLTCAFGECVDAHEPLRERSDTPTEADPQTNVGTVEQGVKEAEACSDEGKRSCAPDSELQPLVCQQGVWQTESICSETTRCDRSALMTHGTCQPLAAECAMRDAGERFCDSGGAMFECQANRLASRKLCGDNERCVEVADDVRCNCLPGFVTSMQGCIEATDCRESGGCDRMTTCVMQSGKPICTECPGGYGGTGETGCYPLLSDLVVAPGTLEPAFDPEVNEYTLVVPLLAQHITVDAKSEAEAELFVNNASVMGQSGTTTVLALGQTQLPVTLRTGSGARSDYVIDIEHAEATQTYLKASQVDAGDWFGAYIAAHGDTLVVGACNETVNGLSNAGAVYVFVRENGQWREQQRITSPNPASNDLFGVSVALWGDRMIAGNPGNIFSSIGSATRAGSAFSYVRRGDSWSLEQKIELAADGGGDGFGFILVLREDTLLIGAPLDDRGAMNSGAGHVFTRSGGSWQLQQSLKASTPQAESHFGTMMALDADVLAISAWHETVDGNTWGGAVYPFERRGDNWAPGERIVAPTPRARAQFGGAVAVQGDTLVVAAPHNPPEGDSNRSGEVHVFKRSGDGYRALQYLEAPQPALGDRFGHVIVMRAGSLIVGAPGVGAGDAYLYADTNEGFVRTASLRSKNGDVDDSFGYSVGLTEDFAIVAALHEDGGAVGINGDATNNDEDDSGAVFVFE